MINWKRKSRTKFTRPCFHKSRFYSKNRKRQIGDWPDSLPLTAHPNLLLASSSEAWLPWVIPRHSINTAWLVSFRRFLWLSLSVFADDLFSYNNPSLKMNKSRLCGGEGTRPLLSVVFHLRGSEPAGTDFGDRIMPHKEFYETLISNNPWQGSWNSMVGFSPVNWQAMRLSNSINRGREPDSMELDYSYARFLNLPVLNCGTARSSAGGRPVL